MGEIDDTMESYDCHFDNILADYLQWKEVDPKDCPPAFLLNNIKELVRYAWANGRVTGE